jgi:GT2 family glycosyltransferase
MDAPACAVSVVVCSIDPAKYERVTATYARQLAGVDHELIGIHDARSLAEAYNRAAQQARGELVVFSHDDVDIVSEDLAGALERALRELDVVGVVGTSKLIDAFWPAAGHPWLHGWMSTPQRGGDGYYVHVYGVDAPVTGGLDAVDGMFFAVRRAVLSSVAFDAATFDGFHCYDVDFCCAARRAGFRIGTTAEIAVVHASDGSYGAEWERYRARFADKYRGVLPVEPAARPWSLARVPVATSDDIVRRFPLARLAAITAQLRARP